MSSQFGLNDALRVALRALWVSNDPDAIQAYALLRRQLQRRLDRANIGKPGFCNVCPARLKPGQERYCCRSCRQRAYRERKLAAMTPPYFCSSCGWHPCRCAA